MSADKKTTGTLIAASLGPGDPGLITRAAFTALEKAACWAFPIGRADGHSYALSIAERAGLTPPPNSLGLQFPMTRNLEILAASWLQAARETLAVLEQGIDVVFLVEGDASFYATFGHLERTIRGLAPELAVQIIPGVSSPLAGAALTGEALCEGDEMVAIAPSTAGREKIAMLLERFDAVVLLKVKPRLPEILALLAEKNLTHRTSYIERAGAPNQRVVRDVSRLDPESAHYLSLLIVHCGDGSSLLGMNG